MNVPFSWGLPYALVEEAHSRTECRLHVTATRDAGGPVDTGRRWKRGRCRCGDGDHALAGGTRVEQDAVDAIAAATSLAGTLWHIATPGPEVAALYQSDPRLAHAIVEIQPRLTRILTALLDGMTNTSRRVR